MLLGIPLNVNVIALHVVGLHVEIQGEKERDDSRERL
jgi:hypothetical protein